MAAAVDAWSPGIVRAISGRRGKGYRARLSPIPSYPRPWPSTHSGDDSSESLPRCSENSGLGSHVRLRARRLAALEHRLKAALAEQDYARVRRITIAELRRPWSAERYGPCDDHFMCIANEPVVSLPMLDEVPNRYAGGPGAPARAVRIATPTGTRQVPGTPTILVFVVGSEHLYALDNTSPWVTASEPRQTESKVSSTRAPVAKPPMIRVSNTGLPKRGRRFSFVASTAISGVDATGSARMPP